VYGRAQIIGSYDDIKSAVYRPHAIANVIVPDAIAAVGPGARQGSKEQGAGSREQGIRRLGGPMNDRRVLTTPGRYQKKTFYLPTGFYYTPTWPGLADTRPGLADTRPGLADTRPGLADTRPGLADTRPGLADTRPGLADTRPGLADTRPGLANPGPGKADPDSRQFDKPKSLIALPALVSSIRRADRFS